MSYELEVSLYRRCEAAWSDAALNIVTYTLFDISSHFWHSNYKFLSNVWWLLQWRRYTRACQVKCPG